MERVDSTFAELVGSYPDEVETALVELDAIITSCLPGRRRSIWEGVFWGGSEQRIAGYGDIVQPRPRGNDVAWFLVGLARQQRSYSVYVNAVDDGEYLLSRYAGRLGKVKVGSASLSFGAVDDLDRAAFRELLGRSHELTPPDASDEP